MILETNACICCANEVLGSVKGEAPSTGTAEKNREHAMESMVSTAENMGADAIINIRYVNGKEKTAVYGTAVKLRK